MTDPQYTSEITVEKIRAFADDQWVADAARVSTGRDQVEGIYRRPDALIRKLMHDRHGTPFEHGGVFTFRVHAPIFVFREWQRHRVGWSYNEQSGRYTEFEPVFYVPPADRPLTQAGKPMDYDMRPGNKDQAALSRLAHEGAYAFAWDRYEGMLRAGIAREVARDVLPLATYSSMYATCNPRSLMHFLGLRTDEPSSAFPSHPQWEIDKAARVVEAEFARAMPVTYDAWNENGRVAP